MSKNIEFINDFDACDCVKNCTHTNIFSYRKHYPRVLDAVQPKKVFEWGPGENSKMALARNALVYAVEQNKKWVLKSVPGLVQIVLAVEDELYPTFHGHDDCDIYFVDSRRRQECIEYVAANAQKPRHVVYVHDAQRKRYHDALRNYKYVKFVGQGNAVASNDAYILDI